MEAKLFGEHITSTFMLFTKFLAKANDVAVTKYNQYDDIFGVITGTTIILRFSPLIAAKRDSICL
jgi:hypothetical protein